MNLFGSRWIPNMLSHITLPKSDCNVAKAVLYDLDGTVLLEKTFNPIHMQNGDSVELTWKLDANNGGLTSRVVDLNTQTSQADTQVFISDDPDYEAAVLRWKESFGEE